MTRSRLILLILLAIGLATLLAIYKFRKEKEQQEQLILFGNVDVRQVDLGFRVSGLVTTMPFQEGDLVHQGDLVAVLDKQPFADQVMQAEAQVAMALSSFKNAEQVLKRRRELVQDGSISQEDFTNASSSHDENRAGLKQAEAALAIAKTNLRFTEIYAPADGIILTRIREPGSTLLISEPVYTLSLFSPIWIRAFVSESDLGLIYPGMLAEISTDAGKLYQGQIGFISPVAEFTPKTVETTQLRSDLVYRLRIIANNPDKFLRQGMPVTVKLSLKKNQDP